MTVPAATNVLREPAPDGSRIGQYVRWLEQRRGLVFDDYRALHRWSIDDLQAFWSSVWEFAGVRAATSPTAVLTEATMPGVKWFPGATLNYAEHATLPVGVDPASPAIVGVSQTRDRLQVTWAELAEQVGRARQGLRRLGVGPGDRVAAYLPNVPETVVAFLATASLGAVWAACAPEFGPRSVLDRFAQIEPKVLLTVSGYRYGTKDIDRRAEVAEVRAGLATLDHVVQVPYGPSSLPDTLTWPDLLAEPGEAAFDPVPFDHPLCVLFSSGTTGRPKAIVHGHGGILLEHFKNHLLSWDLRAGDRMLWFTTTAWMMWNSLVSGLLAGASIATIRRQPGAPGPRLAVAYGRGDRHHAHGRESWLPHGVPLARAVACSRP